MTLVEFKKLPYSQMDTMVDETLMWIECDKDSPDRKTASEIIDSIYGPYDPVMVNGLDEYDAVQAHIRYMTRVKRRIY